MEVVHLQHHGQTRLYLWEAAQTPQRPTMIVLHGTGGTAAWAEEELGWRAVAARENFNLVIPEGLPPNPALPAKFLSNPPRWNDGSEFALGLPTNPPDDVDFLTEVLHNAVTRGQADPHQVYLTGFSNGAGMCFRFASERAELLAAVAPVAGYCWVPQPQPRRPVPTCYLVGDADPLIPWNGGPARLPWGNKVMQRPTVHGTLERWAIAIACSPTPVEVQHPQGLKLLTYPGSTRFQAIRVPELGHHWPGGKGQMNPRIAGQPSNLLDGNSAIWAFCRGREVLN